MTLIEIKGEVFNFGDLCSCVRGLNNRRLTNRRPSVLWNCWLGHLTRKIVSEMTYNVSSGTLNPSIPYGTIGLDLLSNIMTLWCVLLLGWWKCDRNCRGSWWWSPGKVLTILILICGNILPVFSVYYMSCPNGLVSYNVQFTVVVIK